MKQLVLGLLAVLASWVVPAILTAQTTQAALDERIDQAIERGVRHIWTTQRPNGMFSDARSRDIFSKYKFPGDREVMAMVALAYAGESLKKPEMQKGLKALMELDLKFTYTLSFRIITLAELGRRADARRRSMLRRAISRDVRDLIALQRRNGGWYYEKTDRAGYWDFSNTQIAVLALREAALAGVEVRRDVFRRTQELYLDKQLADGGWNYGRPGRSWDKEPSYGSMTAAAVASLFITRNRLNPGQGCPCRGGLSRRRRNLKLEKAMARGRQWLGKNFTAQRNPAHSIYPRSSFPYYWLYGCERVGIATGLKYFGTKNWYAEGAGVILSRQKGDGSWPQFYETAFALLFLIKGRGPILLNKVEHEGGWDLHAFDALHLAQFVGRMKEQRFNWQVVNLNVPLEELHDSPILYITTESPLKLSDKHKQKLRDFTDAGGTILLEASCGNTAAAQWLERTCKEIWPEWELKALDKDHDLWSADLKIGDRRPVIRGISDGLRTFVFYCPRDISCKWHTMSVARDEALFQMGNNLYAYATDRGKLRGRLAARQIGTGKKYAAARPSWQGAGKPLAVARLAHGGRWHLNRRYHPWTLLAKDLKATLGIDLVEREPIAAGKDVPADVDVLYLTGRERLQLDEAALERLRRYLVGGGLLLAEATMGNDEFGKSFQEVAAAMKLTLRPLGVGDSILSGNFGGRGRGYRVDQVGFTFALRVTRAGQGRPLVYGIYLPGDPGDPGDQGGAEKLVGIYSPFDIIFSQTGCRAFSSRGYAAGDARALAVNIALFAATRRSP